MWNEDDSRTFIDFGRYFVPERQTQFQVIRDLIPGHREPFHLLELGCGDGLLAETVLAHFAACTVHGYDGSAEMLRQAGRRLARYGNRFETRLFDLADDSWRQPFWNPLAVVSSLVIHHLDEDQKKMLFDDIFRMLAPGGVFIIADLIQPMSEAGLKVAADAWDAADTPDALGMPLQFMVTADAVVRTNTYPTKGKNVAFNPCGQVIGSVNTIKPVRLVMQELIEGYLDAVERLNDLMPE